MAVGGIPQRGLPDRGWPDRGLPAAPAGEGGGESTLLGNMAWRMIFFRPRKQ